MVTRTLCKGRMRDREELLNRDRLELLKRDRVELLNRERVELLNRDRVELLNRERVELLNRDRVELLNRDRVELLNRDRVELLNRDRVELLNRDRVELLNRDRVELLNRDRVELLNRDRVELLNRDRVELLNRDRVELLNRDRVELLNRDRVELLNRDRVELLNRDKVELLNRDKEFEEQILTACQESQDLAACFTSYQEARQRLRDKAKGRGFWPVTGSKGRGKGKKGKSPGGGARFGAQGNQSFGGRRRSLADRIANSTCRRCGQAGHWKRECPLSSTPTPGGLGKKPNEMESFTGILQTDEEVMVITEDIGLDAAVEVVDDLPQGAVAYLEEADDEAIIDTGASRAVIGAERLKKLVRSLPPQIGKRVMQVPSEGVVFKFGNAGKLTSNCAVMLPRAQKGPNYLDRMLTTPMDGNLMGYHTHGDLPQALVRPPDINTLTDWGYLKAPSGKHASKSFAAIYELDQGYVNQMWNRRGVSSWVRSFQMYSRARRAASEEAKRRGRQGSPSTSQGPPMTPPQMPVPPMSSMASNTVPQPISQGKLKEKDKQSDLEEWTQIPVETSVPCEGNKGKRVLDNPTTKMETQPNKEKIVQIQTQIAILQRELQKETSGTEVFQHPESLEDHERPEMAQEALQLQKRRRVSLKQPENSLYGKAPTWHDVFRQAGHSTPRVGNAFYKGEEGDAVFRMVQQLVPDMTVKLVVACRGTDRHRIQPAAANCEVFPWRKTVLVARNSGEIVDLGPPEKWSTLTRARQIRSTGAARISLSIFGIKDEDGVVVDPPSAAVSSDRDSAEGQSPVCVPNEDQVMAEPSNSNGENFAWVPRIIPKSGPGFLMLDKGEQVELRRLHNNLGHPDPDKMVRFLTERGAKPEIVAGAKDMSCDTCVETQNRPKLSQPSRIHENLDFNDVVGADGAYWTNAQGKTFHFMHFIDESTLYHLGAVCARKVEDQIRVFLQAWVQWAGPCTLLYLDPAGEYISDEWSAALQSEGIRVSMTAAESHWQNGRAEAHGRIIKNMLTRMEKDQSILTVEDFSRCLRQAFAAKNSLSRVNGFTPEQCLLGKSRRLPGSLTSDFDAASHSLAESSSPEGIRFRDLSSRQGTLKFSTDTRLAQNERTVVCPIAWSSRKIPRVVTSTLSAESMALSSALDRLGYIRVMWEWLKDPAVDWANPSQVLAKAPTSSAVTDCKSVYDLATKTSVPVCTEYRTTLECLLIRERLRENVAMRWISTQAMLADSLTKSMDSGMLRECLKSGRYTLFDEGESLRQRASKRERLQWLKDGTASKEHGCDGK
ncbi:unnamed protein product [Cladocopium goreaui]|uniref:Uncharacterized protein n=1 Tax=Cladocopium goreaui TaxID=2562237 RepID=A0A9P1FU03_9DINO|nr:unnamed protein product [Cladocopium goreaui]